jgi:hypothetical protein
MTGASHAAAASHAASARAFCLVRLTGGRRRAPSDEIASSGKADQMLDLGASATVAMPTTASLTSG